MKQVKCFSAYFSDVEEHPYNYIDVPVCGEVENVANQWLAQHPDVVILASHTTHVMHGNRVEFTLTLIVELP